MKDLIEYFWLRFGCIGNLEKEIERLEEFTKALPIEKRWEIQKKCNNDMIQIMRSALPDMREDVTEELEGKG
jgi:hypothetical protein